jgi:ketosteroid isomerase-like protein
MSEENVERMRRSFDAVNRRDLDALLALTDTEVVAAPRILAIEGGALRGHDGIRAWWDGVFTAFPDFNIEVIGIRGIDDVTLANVLVRGHGQGSGAPFEDRAGSRREFGREGLSGGKRLRLKPQPSKPPGYRNSEDHRLGRGAVIA